MAEVVFEDWERQRVEGSVGVISTIGPQGAPYSSPVQLHFEGDALAFETDPSSAKFRNISAEPRVAICVYGQPKWGVVVRGRAEVRAPGGQGAQAQILVRPSHKASWRRKEG